MLALRVPNVDLVIFASTGNEDLICTTKARVDGVVALGDALKFANQNAVFQIPEMHTLVLHVEKSITTRLITNKRHYGMVFFNDIEVGYIFEIVSSYSVMSISSKNGFAVVLVGETLHSNALPIVDDSSAQVNLIKMTTRATNNKLLAVLVPGTGR